MSPARFDDVRHLADQRGAVLMAGVLVERLGVARQQSMHLGLFSGARLDQNNDRDGNSRRRNMLTIIVTLALVWALWMLYKLAESIGRGLPRWGDE